MKMLKSRSVGMSILASLFFVILLEILVSLAGLKFLNDVNARLRRIVDIDEDKLILAYHMQQELIDLRRDEKNMLLSMDPGTVYQMATNINVERHEVDRIIDQMHEMADQEGKSLLREFRKRLEEYLEISYQVQALVNQDIRSVAVATPSVVSEAVLLHNGRGREAFQKVEAALASILNKVDQDSEAAKRMSDRSVDHALGLMGIFTLLSVLAGLMVGGFTTRSITGRLHKMVRAADGIAGGNLNTPIEAMGRDEVGRLALAMSEMQTALRRSANNFADQDWIKTGLNRLDKVMRGNLDLSSLCGQVIHEISTYMGAQIGALYILEENGSGPALALAGHYAGRRQKGFRSRFPLGEGLVGQAALTGEQILVRDVPQDYFQVTSGVGETLPRRIAVTPFHYKGEIKGVVEIACMDEISPLAMVYLEEALSALGINISNVEGRERLARALAESQALAERLQEQQEELKATNEELEEQTQLLKESEAKLEAQQEELRVSNEELEEKNETLTRQKKEIEKANGLLARSRAEIEQKAEELALAGKYKSDFLANMSHELRTPLNSLLLLARILSDNEEGNLTPEQVESAAIIYQSGNELLALISDILDLSKIEAGKMEVKPAKVAVADLAENIRSSFGHMATEKGISFSVQVDEKGPQEILTDRKRLEQIIRNLVSNAIKFTARGGVEVTFGHPAPGVDTCLSQVENNGVLAIRVQDSGIGIAPDKKETIFEAFQQLDSGNRKKYGGTGLGLSISRQLINLLGGEIQVESEVDNGSAFTIYLPLVPGDAAGNGKGENQIAADNTADAPVSPSRPPRAPAMTIEDDRDAVGENDKVILVIEDDLKFAALLLKRCRRKGFKALIAPSGEEGLELVRRHMVHAILLDLNLPGLDGWSVLAALKDSPKTRHIPVHIISVDEETLEALKKGAVGFLQKPVTRESLETAFERLEAVFERKIKSLLVVEDDEVLRRQIIKVIGNGDVHATEAGTGAQALSALREKRFDCMVLDLGLPDMNGFDLLKRLEKDTETALPPVIVYSGKELSREEALELQQYAHSIIIKGVRSEERLLDEVSLFLHRMVDRLPPGKQRIITDLYDVKVVFRDKTILLVEDDMRNLFVLSKILEDKGMRVLKAENGARALEMLDQDPGVDLVLMDIMMPVMDGLEAMEKIRKQLRFQDLPIIALTAKAMKGDRDAALAAGANDYMPKPVDLARLFSMLRIWLYR